MSQLRAPKPLRSFALVTAAAVGILTTSNGAAQALAGQGSISGVVRDASGASVPDALVEVDNEAKGVHRTVKTDSDGMFAVLALSPAAGYSVTVSKNGFATHEHLGITVLVGEDTNLNVPLTVAAAHEKVTVEGAAAAVDQSKMGIAQVVHDSQILNLPINGRRVDTYVLLTPAVVPDGVTGLVSFRGIAGGNAFLTDGNDTSNQFFHENAGRTKIYTQISQDAVQEFQVLSSGYSAEYGRASGGIINTVTRSGTNQTHGTAYWFFRNRMLNARDPHSLVEPPEWRHQAGASLGGRFVRDKLFYFFNAEIHRRYFPLVASLGRPPLFDAAGRFTGTCDAAPQQCSAALQFLGRQFQTLERRADSELLFGKLDWHPSQRHLFSGSFNYLKWVSPNGYQTEAALNSGEGVGGNGNSSVRTRYGRLSWNYIGGAARINELRFGWFKDRHSDTINGALVPPQTGLVQIVVEGQNNLGVSPELSRINPSENRFQLANTTTVVAARHVWKFGFDWVATQDYLKYLRNRNGTYEYPDFTSFALDFSGNTGGQKRWQAYSQRFGNEIFDETIRDYNFFAADQFRFNSRLTLSYGLRYEYAQLPQPPRANPDYPESGHIPSSRRNFAPRFGFSYAFGQARTLVRGGYGIFYARYHNGLIGTFFLENGAFQQAVRYERGFLSAPAFGPVFPNTLPSAAADPGVTSATDVTFPSKDFRNPYTHQADIGVEHAFLPTVNLSVSYLWSRGLHLTTVRDLNIGPPGLPVSYEIDDAQGRAVGIYDTPLYRLSNRVNSRWRRVNSVESGGNSYYNALVVQLRKTFSKGFEGFVAYTWSHTIDYNLGGGSDNIFFSDGPRSLRNGDYRGEKASSQLDQRHRLVVSSTYQPLRALFSNRWARVFANLRLSQISTLASAQPATPTVLVSGVPFPGAAFNTTLNGFGGSTRVPFLPASSLDIDQVVRTDARLTKVIGLAERVQMHINLEAFNVFNRVSSTTVNTIAYQARSGVLRPVERLGEGVASQGYPDGTNARRAQVSLRLTW